MTSNIDSGSLLPVKIIVLDDDPTGTQTVHDVPIFTEWTEEAIREGFDNSDLFYILTNSRGMTEAETTRVHVEALNTIIKISKERKNTFLIISRSDSTLRGHYPLETKIIKQEIEKLTDITVDGEILCPFFKEGGRFTVGDIHIVLDGRELIPAAETEFAGDLTFGYTKSDLKEYIEEKTRGEYPAGNVVSIDLGSLRRCEIESVKEKLLAVKDFNKVIVNALDYRDLEVFCQALDMAMKEGKYFIFRSAAALVKVMGHVSSMPLLGHDDFKGAIFTDEGDEESRRGGLVVVGSHTKKTTMQYDRLEDLSGIDRIPFDSNLIVNEEKIREEIKRVAFLAEKSIFAGRTAVVCTSRQELALEHEDKIAALKISIRISDAVCEIVRSIKSKPSFIVTKGGITSSDVATKALEVKSANVLGQIKPGIPVWQTGKGSRYPGIPLVIFPGNVGDKDTLKQVMEILI